jgi:hypothetical protein
MWEFSNHSNPKARKDHRCDECGKRIKTGETYSRMDGKWEGEMTSHKAHTDCAALCDALYRHDNLGAYDEYPRLQDYVGDKEYSDIYISKYPEVFARFGIIKKVPK